MNGFDSNFFMLAKWWVSITDKQNVWVVRKVYTLTANLCSLQAQSQISFGTPPPALQPRLWTVCIVRWSHYQSIAKLLSPLLKTSIEYRFWIDAIQVKIQVLKIFSPPRKYFFFSTYIIPKTDIRKMDGEWEQLDPWSNSMVWIFLMTGTLSIFIDAEFSNRWTHDLVLVYLALWTLRVFLQTLQQLEHRLC